MKILIISPFFYPHTGGSQQYMEELHVNLLQQHPDYQIDVIAYNTDNSPEFEEYRGMKIYRLPCIQVLPGQFAIPNYFKLWKLIKNLHQSNHYDYINANTRFFDSAWWTPWIGHTFGVKTILTDHCADYPTHKNSLVTWIARTIDKYFVPLFIRHFDLIVATNQSTHIFLQKMGMKNIHVVYGGVDTDIFKPRSVVKKRSVESIAAPFDESQLIVTFVGRMIYSKGPQLLFEIGKQMIQKYPHVHLIFAGNGKMYDHLHTSTEKNIYFLGRQNKQQIAHLLQNTDILVHPSLHNEGFPNVLLEAGASGCAVVATDQGGTKEIIKNKKTGLLVQPNKEDIANALEFLINEPSQKYSYQQAIRKHIETNFDWKGIARVYNKLLT